MQSDGIVHSGFDHVAIAVTELEEARRFFGLLGFVETKTTVVSGTVMSEYMGIPDWEAEHVTLRLTGAATHQEVQLLQFHRPVLVQERDEADLARLGINHLCFAVDDLDATLSRLATSGITPRNEPMEFHDRRIVFVPGPDGVVIELAQWLGSAIVAERPDVAEQRARR